MRTQKQFSFSILILLVLAATAQARQLVTLNKLTQDPHQQAAAGHHPKGMYLPYDFSFIKPGQTLQLATTLPTTFNWYPASTTAVENQGAGNDCWVFTAFSMFEAIVNINEKPAVTPDYSKQDLVDYFPSTVWNNGGNCFMSTAYLTRYGAANASACPYLVPAAQEAWNPSLPRVKRVRDWDCLGDCSGSDSNSVTAIKQALYNNGPVACSISVACIDNWNSSFDMNWTSSPTECIPVLTGWSVSSLDHAVVIVGWNDNMTYTGGSGQGAWLAKNSWGPSWGYNGYFWIAYGSAGIGYLANYVPRSGYTNLPSSEVILAYDSGFSGQSWGSLNQSQDYQLVKFSKAFSGQENLTGVDVIAMYPNMAYTVTVYSNFDGTQPTGMLANQSGTWTNAGSYFVALKAPVPVSSGVDFYVEVYLNSGVAANFYLICTDMGNGPFADGTFYISDTGQSGDWTLLEQTGQPLMDSSNLMIRARLQPPPNQAGHWTIYH